MHSVLGQDRRYALALDVLNLNELVDRCMGNTQFAQRVLGRFQERLDQDLVEIKQAASADDLELVAQLAHRIKGAAANVAARAVVKVAAEIEFAAKDDDGDTVWSRLPVLGAERDRLKRSILQFAEPDGVDSNRAMS